MHQVVDAPELRINVDRIKAGQLGLTQRRRRQQPADFSERQQPGGAQLLAELEERRQLQRADPDAAIQAGFDRQADADAGLRRGAVRSGLQHPRFHGGRGQPGRRRPPERRPIKARRPTAIPGALPYQTQLLSNLATIEHSTGPEIANHYNVQPVFDVYANIDRRDLGGVASQVEKIIRETKIPKTTQIFLRGQAATMQSSFYRLGLGLLAAIVLVYLLMAVNFQSWVDPFIILTALPGALAGILWMLFVTQTTLNVPSLMGAIMCIGVATANSILMVVFANDERMEGKGARAAALSAGYTRLRPVLMTAAGDDSRHAADGARDRRGRRAERAAGPGGDRRLAAGHRDHAADCADRLQLYAQDSRPSITTSRSKKKSAKGCRNPNSDVLKSH